VQGISLANIVSARYGYIRLTQEGLEQAQLSRQLWDESQKPRTTRARLKVLVRQHYHGPDQTSLLETGSKHALRNALAQVLWTWPVENDHQYVKDDDKIWWAGVYFSIDKCGIVCHISSVVHSLSLCGACTGAALHIEIGGEYFFNNTHMLQQVKRIILIYQCNKWVTPRLLYDNAPSHRKRAEDARNASRITMKDGSVRQPIMRTGQFNPFSLHRLSCLFPSTEVLYYFMTGWFTNEDGERVQQSFAYQGGPKGATRICNERKIAVTKTIDDPKKPGSTKIKKLTIDELRTILAAQPDFLADQDTLLDTAVACFGDKYKIEWLPKCHPELAFVEQLNGYQKWMCQIACNRHNSVPVLRDAVKCILRSEESKVRAFQRDAENGFENGVAVELCKLRNWYDHTRRFYQAYYDGVASHLAPEVVTKVYKKHRDAPTEHVYQKVKEWFATAHPEDSAKYFGSTSDEPPPLTVESDFSESL
jgi:hypothetical protein